MTYFLAVVAAGTLGTGFVLQQRAAQRAPPGSFLRLRLLAVLLRDRGWLAGLLTTWPGYVLIVVGALSIWLTQSAFSAGPLHASLPPSPLVSQ